MKNSLMNINTHVQGMVSSSLYNISVMSETRTKG